MRIHEAIIKLPNLHRSQRMTRCPIAAQNVRLDCASYWIRSCCTCKVNRVSSIILSLGLWHECYSNDDLLILTIVIVSTIVLPWLLALKLINNTFTWYTQYALNNNVIINELIGFYSYNFSIKTIKRHQWLTWRFFQIKMPHIMIVIIIICNQYWTINHF